tara:strand:+ start:1050 stop:1208 length:159 start_codon:yes stop_codon:yes gene_type:complete
VKSFNHYNLKVKVLKNHLHKADLIIETTVKAKAIPKLSEKEGYKSNKGKINI